MQSTDITDFRRIVWGYYNAYGRYKLPWRLPEDNGSFDAYKVLVSELMLQQTQVARVIPKYLAFIEKYPTVQTLAQAPLSGVLTIWSGLGYNRRAKFLRQAAQAIVRNFNGQIPMTTQELITLPGIGPNTAGAILAYAYNQPVVFIETNIRTVFFHHFFDDQTKIPDSALLPFLEQSLPQDAARRWYWALMDYGAYLKQTVGNLSRSSTRYAKQSVFAGSRRQIRGQILRLLTASPYTFLNLYEIIPDERLGDVLADLITEGFIEEKDSSYHLRT